jgi:hypothetical protein
VTITIFVSSSAITIPRDFLVVSVGLCIIVYTVVQYYSTMGDYDIREYSRKNEIKTLADI